MSDRLLYKVEEAAPMLGMGRATVYREIAAGRLKSVQVGRSRRISRAALEEYVTDLEQSAVPAA